MRTFGFPCAISLLAAVVVGCGGSDKDRSRELAVEGSTPRPHSKETTKDKFKEAVKETVKEAKKDGATETAYKDTTKESKDRARDKDGAPPPREDRDPGRKPMMDEPRAGTDKPVQRPAEDLPAGVLTAGSFDDNLYPHYFRTFAGKAGQNPYVGDLPGKLLGHRLEVRVRNGKGAPVGNARVRVTTTVGQPVEVVSRSDGRAVFVFSWDQVVPEGDVEVSAALPGEEWVTRRVPKDAPDCTILLASASAPLPRNLDLAFVLDTTGSMGDELRYLQAEIKGIAAAVRDQFPQVNPRYALVCYRDEGMGDEYVTRVFPFTASMDEFQRNLAAQSAAGGGDLPEAMHRGLEEATRLGWRAADTARVLFLIADAPPHARDAARMLECVNILRKQGVAIYPVAASCNDPRATEATEFFMRAAALLTGAQYLFLTDDSGVGDSHGEPHIPFYRVERLNRLMIRTLTGELSGRRTDPAPGDILRTVGRLPRQTRQD